MQILTGIVLGLVAWFLLRILLMGVYTVDQNERAVKTRFGRAVRVPGAKTTLDDPIAEALRPEEKPRYTYPQVRVIPPGGPYFKMPWERIRKVSIATMTVISINDLRKNLRDLNEYMDNECRTAPARYGVILDASLITGIDPPPEVESGLAAINTAHNQVSSDISLAQAAADQRVVQSRRAVEIETLRAQAEVEPVKSLAAELGALHRTGPGILASYLRNVRLALYDKAQQIYLEAGK